MALRVPSTQTRHLLNRFSYGVTPALVRQAESHGGAAPWLEWQMNPGAVGDSWAAGLYSWFPYLSHTPGKMWQAQLSGERDGWQIMHDFVRWTILRRTYSQRQLLEVMTDFWSNLLHIPAPVDRAWPHRVGYDEVIRANALGRFDNMLIAATTHPAMGCYLDNAESTVWKLNENLGRELLELHTVGRTSGYTEEDVVNSARILTGYRVDINDSWVAFYSPDDHYTGPVSVLGFSSANSKPDGSAVARAYLRYLARHRATARNIARRLCVRFVSDNPSLDLIVAVTNAFISSGTDIKATLRALVSHPEFAESMDAKVRTPSEDAIATYRALGIRGAKPSSDNDFSNVVNWHAESVGQRPFDWPRPDGWPDVADAWTSAGRLLGSWGLHRSLASGYPAHGATYRSPHSWLPALPARFDTVVDHVSRQVLARPAPETLLHAAVEHVAISRGKVIRVPDDLPPYRMNMLLSTLLDSPQHMTR
jgi:hypothetical protein